MKKIELFILEYGIQTTAYIILITEKILQISTAITIVANFEIKKKTYWQKFLAQRSKLILHVQFSVWLVHVFPKSEPMILMSVIVHIFLDLFVWLSIPLYVIWAF